MRANIPQPLAEHLERLGLVLPDAAERASPWVMKWGRNLPPLEALWIDALLHTGAITAFQAMMLQRGQGTALRIGPYVLLKEIPRLNDRPSFLVRRHDQPGERELIVIDCCDPEQAERLAASAAPLAEAGRRWLREHSWPTADRAAPVVEVGVDGSRFFAAAPHTDGRSLAELVVGRGRFDGVLAAVIARSLLLLAAELDEAGLKPEFVSLHEVRFTDQGGVIVVAPGLADACSANRPLSEGQANWLPGAGRAGDCRRAARAAATGADHSRAAERRRACGALLEQLLFGAADRTKAARCSMRRGIPPELLAVIDELLSLSSNASFRQLADQLPRNDDAVRRLAARRAFRPLAVQRQWLQWSDRVGQRPFDPRRVVQPVLWLLAIVVLLGAGWWGASFKSSFSSPLSDSPCAAQPAGDDLQPMRQAQLGGDGKPIADSAGPTGEKMPRNAQGELGVIAADGLASMWQVMPGSDGSRADGAPSSATAGGGGGPHTGFAEWAAHRGNGGEVVVAAHETGSGLRQAQFADERGAAPGARTPARPAPGRPADLIIDSAVPVDADRLQLRDGQRVRAAPGRRAVIQVPHKGWTLSVDGVVFEHIDFAASQPPKPDSSDGAPMIALLGRQAEFCGCTFEAGGRIAIAWRPTAGAPGNGLTLGRLVMVDCVFRNCRAVVRSEGGAAQVVEAANVLHWGGDAFWLFGEAADAGEPLKLILRQFTLREAGPLIEFAREPAAAVSLTVEADAAVIAPRAGLPALMLHGRRPDRVLDRLVWSGRGSLLSGESPFAMLTREADEVVALDDEAVAVAGLTRGRVEFVGTVGAGIEGQQVDSWHGPSSGEDPPGIVVRRLPRPTSGR